MDSTHSFRKHDDQELVARCSAGEQGAWDELVRRYRNLVYAVPNRAGLPRDVVDDVFQDAFVRLADRIGTIRDGARVRAWLVTTARNLTIDAIRSKRARGREDPAPEFALHQIADDHELPLEKLERMERSRLVRRALARLDTRSRRLLSLLFDPADGDPTSYEGISRELGMPRGSIGPTRARCLQKFRAEYEFVAAGVGEFRTAEPASSFAA